MTMWPEPAEPIGRVTLNLGAGEDEDLLTNMSGTSRIGNTLFMAADERAGLDTLDLIGEQWTDHRCFQIKDLLSLAHPEDEADLEGLAADDGWLWVLGSHARTRPKPEKAPDECIDLAKLADLKDTRARCLLARIPLVSEGPLRRPVAAAGERKAGVLRETKHGNLLSKALKHDPLIGPFMRLPAKEGGVDLEGITVCGLRVAIGMRGPVIATHAVLLEMELAAKKSGKLELAQMPRKRLLAMEGLGIRDLKRAGDDLLILAGPTTSLSGPCAIYRWRNWVNEPAEHEDRVKLHRPERLIDIPFGRGEDHPEGLALWSEDPLQILVVNDSPSAGRCDTEKKTLTADIYALPA